MHLRNNEGIVTSGGKVGEATVAPQIGFQPLPEGGFEKATPCEGNIVPNSNNT
jgi:hypothetical protein